ncbi:hypothetical protein AD998_16975 [bacterium 336/3]|nr:hypothetical protein AD998_16975 [bacterium 336/3]
MKRYIIKSLFVLTAIFSLNACFFKEPGTEIKFTDILIEIEKATQQGDANTKDTREYSVISDGLFLTDSLKINLVGPQQKEDITIAVEVGAGADVSGTTAVAGVHYQLLTPTVVIPAGQSFGFLRFRVFDDNVDPALPVAVRFNLTSTTKGRLSENYKTHRVVIRGRCPFIKSKFIGAYSTLEPGYGTYANTSTEVSETATTLTIQMNNFWDDSRTINYVITKATGAVAIPSQTSGTLTVVSTGTPTCNLCNGNMVVPYRITTTATGAVVENNTHTYTKQ